jgi:hypothetical protein
MHTGTEGHDEVFLLITTCVGASRVDFEIFVDELMFSHSIQPVASSACVRTLQIPAVDVLRSAASPVADKPMANLQFSLETDYFSRLAPEG